MLEAGTIFSHAGDFGDIIYQIVAMQIIGGGKLVLHPAYGRTRTPMTQEHADIIIPLLKCQPYIHDVWWQPEPPENAIKLDGWRDTYHRILKCNLQYKSLFQLNLPLPDVNTPWLTVPEAKRVAATVFHRSDRRHNPLFHWDFYTEEYKHDAVYVAAGNDRRFDFPHHQCPTLLEMASIIAGADRFIGNQSCPLAIAEGLKKPVICEMYDDDSVPFSRDDAQYGPPPPPPPPEPCNRGRRYAIINQYIGRGKYNRWRRTRSA